MLTISPMLFFFCFFYFLYLFIFSPKLRVKCHYVDTRAVLVRADTPLKELIQRVQEKFQSERPLRLKYKDEDHHMLSMIDDEDWLMAQQVHMGVTGGLERM